MNKFEIADNLEKSNFIQREEFIFLLENNDEELRKYISAKAAAVSKKTFGNNVYIRGLVEISSYCKNGCYYCGINSGNKNAQRYRLTENEIVQCCIEGEKLGFKTFVLQGGEDNFYTDDIICRIIKKIKANTDNCAVTLSLGEKSFESYEKFFKSGADRYLLRHETANKVHYEKLHPKQMSFDNRIECLRNLKKIGYQVGCGFMVGSPFQTFECLADDLEFIYQLQPHMVGIGPFIPHNATIFSGEKNGSVNMTLLLISILRLMLPMALIPATTALGTLDPMGREKGILAGGNVLMPNLSPVGVRKKYLLYDNKICTGDEAAQCIGCTKRRMESIGYEVVTDRGDSPLINFGKH